MLLTLEHLFCIIHRRGAPALSEVAGRQIQSTHWGVNLNIVIIPKKGQIVILRGATPSNLEQPCFFFW